MTFGVMHLSQAVAEFMAMYPQLRVQLVLNDRFVDLIEEGFDLTVRVSELPQASNGRSELVVRSLATIRRRLCASPDYLQRHGHPERPEELSDRPCLHYGNLVTGTQWQLFDAAGRERAIAIDGVLCTNNGEVLRDAAIRGLGIAFLPDFIIAEAIERGQLQEILPDYRSSDLHLLALYPQNRHLSAKVRLFADFLCDRFGKDAVRDVERASEDERENKPSSNKLNRDKPDRDKTPS